MTEDIAARFQCETANHEMTVLHDDGLYRHLRFTPALEEGKPRHSMYWFDLITVPGALIFQGDGESFVFRRTTDMFEFFRGSAWKGQPNLQYWAEKLTDRRDHVMVYQQELLEQHVKEVVAEAIAEDGSLADLERAVQEDVLDELIGDESLDFRTVETFEFYIDKADRYRSDKAPDFRFHDVWEWGSRDYNWWFQWACHGIVWGIAQYDAATAGAPSAPAVVDVQLPEPAEAVPGA